MGPVRPPIRPSISQFGNCDLGEIYSAPGATGESHLSHYDAEGTAIDDVALLDGQFVTGRGVGLCPDLLAPSSPGLLDPAACPCAIFHLAATLPPAAPSAFLLPPLTNASSSSLNSCSLGSRTLRLSQFVLLMIIFIRPP